MTALITEGIQSIFNGNLQRINRQSKIVVEVSSGAESVQNLLRLESALETAVKLKDAGADVRLVFDGAGTKWVPKIANPRHRLNKLFSALVDRAPAACKYCASTFHVEAAVRNSGVILLDEYHSQSRINDLISTEYETVSF